MCRPDRTEAALLSAPYKCSSNSIQPILSRLRRGAGYIASSLHWSDTLQRSARCRVNSNNYSAFRLHSHRTCTLSQSHKSISKDKYNRDDPCQRSHITHLTRKQLDKAIHDQSHRHAICDRICKWHEYDCTKCRQCIGHIAEIHILDVAEH